MRTLGGYEVGDPVTQYARLPRACTRDDQQGGASGVLHGLFLLRIQSLEERLSGRQPVGAWLPPSPLQVLGGERSLTRPFLPGGAARRRHRRNGKVPGQP